MYCATICISTCILFCYTLKCIYCHTTKHYILIGHSISWQIGMQRIQFCRFLFGKLWTKQRNYWYLGTVMFIMTTRCVLYSSFTYRGGGGDLITDLTAPLSPCDEIIPNWCQYGSDSAPLPAQPGRSVRGLDPWCSSGRCGFTPNRKNKAVWGGDSVQ